MRTKTLQLRLHVLYCVIAELGHHAANGTAWLNKSDDPFSDQDPQKVKQLNKIINKLSKEVKKLEEWIDKKDLDFK